MRSDDAGTAPVAGDVVTPTVFMFQPTKFEIVPPEKLGEWEDELRRRVGVQRVTQKSPSIRRSGLACYSWCGDVVFDDCDEL